MKNKIIDALKERVSKLPVSFLVGAAVGGALYLYSVKTSKENIPAKIGKLGKIAAPYLILALLDKLAENYSYESQDQRIIEDVEAEIG